MPREKQLDFNVAHRWLAAWSETELYSDAAVLDLASLIDDPCLVVVTRGVGRQARSLVFRTRFFNPKSGPARWSAADAIHVGDGRHAPIILNQGKQPCSFVEALACAYEHARWGNDQVIYTYDDSAAGNA